MKPKRKKNDRSFQGDKFERFTVQNVACPACGRMSLKLLKTNFASIDAACDSADCIAGVSCKYDKKDKLNASFRCTPASKAGYESVVKLWGEKNLFVVAGTEKRHKVYRYVGHKTTTIKPRRTQIEGRVILEVFE